MLFRSIPVPVAQTAHSPLLNWGVLLVIVALIYYFVLAWRLAIGMTVVMAAVIAVIYGASYLPARLWLLSVTVFVFAWIGQFIGHKIEGKKPSFFKDIQFLLIGPLWLLASVYRGARLAY